jgi:TRAP-type transport system periplasmic protein
MKKNRWLAMAALVAGVTLIVSGMASAAPVRARVSLSTSPTHPLSIGMQVFERYVEAKTRGGIQVSLYYSSQFSSERESLEQVRSGSLEMAAASAGPLAAFNRHFMVLDIPFAFDSYEIAWAVLDGYMGQTLLSNSEGMGFKGLAYLENGFRHVTNNVRPINGPDDLKGMNIRTLEAPMHLEIFKVLGANPTPVPWTELHRMLEQKMVDGQESPLAGIWEGRMFEVQTYCSLTGHIHEPMPLMANLKWFNKLSREYQTIVKEGAILAQNYSRYVTRAREDAIVEKLAAKGMKVNALTPAARENFRTRSQGAVVARIKAAVDRKFVDAWLAAVTTVNRDVDEGF